MDTDKYALTLIELLRQWMEAHVIRNADGTLVVASNTCVNINEAVEAVAKRFAPPDYPPRWDLAVPVVVRVAAWMMLSQQTE